MIGQGRHGRDSRRSNDGCTGLEIVAGTKAESALGPAFIAVPPFHRMTEAADLRGPPGLDLFRMNDLATERLRVGRRSLLSRCQPGFGVALAGPVAGLAGDSQFPHLRVPG